MTKTKAILALKSVIKSLETRNDKGELLYISAELYMLYEVLEYIQNTPAKRKENK